jgi:hypothetical protein
MKTLCFLKKYCLGAMLYDMIGGETLLFYD